MSQPPTPPSPFSHPGPAPAPARPGETVRRGSEEYVALPRFFVLDEHSYVNKHGRPVHLTRQRLERIAANSNRLCQQGDPIPIIPGHTDDTSPAEAQPRIVGEAVDFRVEPFIDEDGVWRSGRYAISALPLAKRHEVETFRQMPRRSVELWEGREQIDPIALLSSQTPERHLGRHRFAAAEAGPAVACPRARPHRFARGGDRRTIPCPAPAPPRAAALPKRFSMADDNTPPEGGGKPPADGNAAVAQFEQSELGKRVLAMLQFFEPLMAEGGQGGMGAEGEGDPLNPAGGMGGGMPGGMPGGPGGSPMPPGLLDGAPAPGGGMPGAMPAMPPVPVHGGSPEQFGASACGPMNASMPGSRHQMGAAWGGDEVTRLSAFVQQGFAAQQQFLQQLAGTVQQLQQGVALQQQETQATRMARAEAERRESIRPHLQQLAQIREFDFDGELEWATREHDDAKVRQRWEGITRFNRQKGPGPQAGQALGPQHLGGPPGGPVPGAGQLIPPAPGPQRFSAQSFGSGGQPLDQYAEHDLAVQAARAIHAGGPNAPASIQEYLARSVGAQVSQPMVGVR